MRIALVCSSAILLAACSSTNEPGPGASPQASSPSATLPTATTPATTTAAPPATAPKPTATATVTPSPTATPTGAPTASPTHDGVVGTWGSASCGPRTYNRLITFGADGSWSAEDRVSPCPPKAVCVWSGIVMRKGTYKFAGKTVALSGVTEDKRARSLPPSLTLDDKGSLVESMDGVTCTYQRGK